MAGKCFHVEEPVKRRNCRKKTDVERNDFLADFTPALQGVGGLDRNQTLLLGFSFISISRNETSTDENNLQIRRAGGKKNLPDREII